jgi:hypothetical protein
MVIAADVFISAKMALQVAVVAALGVNFMLCSGMKTGTPFMKETILVTVRMGLLSMT